jgi:hypothetical protein
LFVAFQQVDGSSSRQTAARARTRHQQATDGTDGGAITVDTAPGRGSIFHFTIAGETAEISLRRSFRSAAARNRTDSAARAARRG